jgi:radical SAM superfamily enzyme YgiQ (UPF0313 family)
MKLVLLQPPVEDFYNTDIRLQPLGLCYLKAAVKKYLPEIEVVVKDFHRGWGRRTLPLPEELLYLKDFYIGPDKSPFSTFHQYYHFGADFKTIAKEVAGEKPDIVGISSLFSPYYREVLHCAKEIKKIISVPVIAGGSHVSAAPVSILQSPFIDFIIRGEGEKPLVEFLKRWPEKNNVHRIPGLGFKEGKNLILNPVGDNFIFPDLPFPDLSDLETKKYLFEGRPLCFITCSRGCPHNCGFCSVHATFGKYIRRSTESVIEEIHQRYKEGYRVFDFEDDNLTFNMEDMKKLCISLEKEFRGKALQFLAMNGISYLSLDQELLELMKKAGFTNLNISLVSSDPENLNTAKRPHTVEKYIEIIKDAFKLGFNIVSYQILGLPRESLDAMIETLSMNASLPVLCGASPFYLAPGSPLSKKILPNPGPDDLFRARLTAMGMNTKNYTRSDIYTLFIATRIINFLKSAEFEGEEIKLEDALIKLKEKDKRSKLGAKLLEILFRDRKLYASFTDGKKEVPLFNVSLFFRLMKKIPYITTLSGKTLKIFSVI